MTKILDLIDPEYRDLVAGKLIGRDEMSRFEGNIAFYGGSFNPPHDGHVSVMEAALISIADQLVVSVHSHNLATKLGHAELHERVTMVAIVLSSSPLGSHMRIADPGELDGVQNREFDEVTSNLIARDSTPWIVMGQDAVKPTYRQEMRRLPHVVVERSPYADQTNEVLTGPVVRLRTAIDPLHLAAERRKLVARLYDARIGGFHDVIAPDGDRSSYENRPCVLMFSSRIEGHEYLSFTIPSYAVFDGAPTRWALFKTPLHVSDWGSDHLGYFRLSR